MGRNVKNRKERKLENKANSSDASKAILRGAPVSAQKARLVADMIRGLDVDIALQQLMFTPKKSAGMFKKLLESALANAQQKSGDVSSSDLLVKTAFVDQGTNMRRFRPRARGSAYRIQKKSSHLTVVLGYK